MGAGVSFLASDFTGAGGMQFVGAAEIGCIICVGEGEEYEQLRSCFLCSEDKPLFLIPTMICSVKLFSHIFYSCI